MLLFHLVCVSLLLDTNISNKEWTNQCLQEISLKFTFSPISVRSPSDRIFKSGRSAQPSSTES